MELEASLNRFGRYALRTQQRALQMLSAEFGHVSVSEGQRLAQQTQEKMRLRVAFITEIMDEFGDGTLNHPSRLEDRMASAIQSFEVAWKLVVEGGLRFSLPTLHFQQHLPPLPTVPLAHFQGGSEDNPLVFILKTYGVWIEAGVMTLQDVDELHPGIAQKVHNQIRANRRANTQDGGQRPESIKPFFPTKEQALLIRKARYR